jgi:hypothetical protein
MREKRTMHSDEARRGVTAAVGVNYAAQRDAMVAGDADALDVLLAEGFTLTHMTGYVQSGQDWLADVRSGAMTYHAVNDVDVFVDLDGGAPVVHANTVTEATIWGSHGTWPLKLRIHYTCQAGSWLALRTGASIWRA